MLCEHLGLRKILAKEEVESFLDFVFEFLTSFRPFLEANQRRVALGRLMPAVIAICSLP